MLVDLMLCWGTSIRGGMSQEALGRSSEMGSNGWPDMGGSKCKIDLEIVGSGRTQRFKLATIPPFTLYKYDFFLTFLALTYPNIFW